MGAAALPSERGRFRSREAREGAAIAFADTSASLPTMSAAPGNSRGAPRGADLPEWPRRLAGDSLPDMTSTELPGTLSEPQPPPARSPWPGRLVVLAGLVVVGIIARQLLVPGPPPPPAYFEIPSFSLTSHEGEPFGSADLEGHAWIAGFFFTRCPTICPVLLQRQKEVQSRTAQFGDRVQLVTISIDPGHDTPEVMRSHAQLQGLTLDRWTLLTGETEPIQQLVRDGFKEYLKAGPDVPPEEVVHSVRFFLVDGLGRVRGLYDGMDENEVERLVADTRTILKKGSEPRS